MHTDSSAAKGIFMDVVLGASKRQNKQIEVRKTPGKADPADLNAFGFAFGTKRHKKAVLAQFSHHFDSVPGEKGGLSGCDRDQVPRSDRASLSSTRRPRRTTSGAGTCELEHKLAVDPTLHYLFGGLCEPGRTGAAGRARLGSMRARGGLRRYAHSYMPVRSHL